MSIDQLIAIVSAPAIPRSENALQCLNDAQEELGHPIPMDLLELSIRYGSGAFINGDCIVAAIKSTNSRSAT